MFNLSLSLDTVPVLWKTLCVVQVPKVSQPSEAWPYEVHGEAYPQPPVHTVEFHTTHFHICFQHHPVVTAAGEDAWIITYLFDRPQYVKMNGCVSCGRLQQRGSPRNNALAYSHSTQWTLTTIPTSVMCRSSPMTQPLSAPYRRATSSSTGEYSWILWSVWAERPATTKEHVAYFHRVTQTHNGIVDSFKIFGVLINNKLDWSSHTTAIKKKGQTCLHLLRRPRSFGVSTMYTEHIFGFF